jgi:hypothetical protein
MKYIRLNFLKYAVTAFVVLLLCNGVCDPETPDTLSVSPTRLSFTADDTKEEVVDVTTNVDTWLVDVPNGWVKRRKENDKLYISVENYNETDEPRLAEIIVIAGTADPVTVKITQNARNSLSVSPESLSFDVDETVSKTISITTTAQSWDATADASWISLSKQSNSLTVNVVSGNTNSSPRTATIRITAGNALEKTVTVTQAAHHTLSVSPSSLSFAADETGEKTVSVTTNASDWNVTTGVSWITLTKQSNTLRVSVTANSSTSSRSGTITVTAGNATPVTVSVSQQGKNSDPLVPDGIYSANGTPSAPIANPGPGSWTSLIVNQSLGQYFTIANWGGVEGINVWCDYKNGKIVMDGATEVANDNTNDASAYFRVCTFNGYTLTVYPGTYEYVVNYYSSTQTLDFSGTIGGLPALVGLVAISKTTGSFINIVYVDLYANLKFKLTNALSSPQISGDAVITADDLKKYKIREASILEMTNSTTKSSVEKHQIGKESLKVLKLK